MGRPRPGSKATRQTVKKKQPPCATCQPEPLPENIEAINFYQENIEDQWTMYPMGGCLGIRNEAIESAMNMHDVPQKERGAMFKKIKTIGSTIAAEIAAHRKKEQRENAKA